MNDHETNDNLMHKAKLTRTLCMNFWTRNEYGLNDLPVTKITKHYL